MNIATEDFDLPPPGRFRHHIAIMALFAALSAVLSVLIWWFVPNEGDSPLFGWLLNGLRDALLVLVWGTFGVFAAVSTAVLAVVPRRWNSFARLLIAYVTGFAALVGRVFELLRYSAT